MKRKEVDSLHSQANKNRTGIYSSLVFNLALLRADLSLIMSICAAKTVGFGDIKGIGLG